MPAVSCSVKRTTTSLPPAAAWQVTLLSASAAPLSKLTECGGPLTTSAPTLKSGWHSSVLQLASSTHCASAQSMSPLPLSSTPLLQISFVDGVDSVTVTGPCPAGSN